MLVHHWRRERGAGQVLAPDLPRRPLLPRLHLLAGGIAKHDIFHRMPLREAYHHRADSRILYLQCRRPAHQTW